MVNSQGLSEEKVKDEGILSFTFFAFYFHKSNTNSKYTCESEYEMLLIGNNNVTVMIKTEEKGVQSYGRI